MRFRAVVIAVFHLLPTPLTEQLQAGEVRLVPHLLRSGHPVAQIDVRKARFARDFDVIQDHIGAKALLGHVGFVKRINHRQTIRQNIGQADGLEVFGFAILIFDDTAADRCFFDHGGEFEHIHICHAAIGVTGIQIAPEQRILFLGGPRTHGVAAQVRVAFQRALLAFGRFELGHFDAGRQTGRTFRTGRAVQNILRATETLLRQAVIQLFCLLAL